MQCLCLILRNHSVTEITEVRDRNPVRPEIHLGKALRMNRASLGLSWPEELIFRRRLLCKPRV